MNRGEIWTAAGAGYTSKPRPVILVQDDLFSATESIVVVPLTSNEIDAPLTRVPIDADALTGIEKRSFAMVDKITTTRRSRLGERLGRVSAARMVDIERALLVFLGIAG